MNTNETLSNFLSWNPSNSSRAPIRKKSWLLCGTEAIPVETSASRNISNYSSDTLYVVLKEKITRRDTNGLGSLWIHAADVLHFSSLAANYTHRMLNWQLRSVNSPYLKARPRSASLFLACEANDTNFEAWSSWKFHFWRCYQISLSLISGQMLHFVYFFSDRMWYVINILNL